MNQLVPLALFGWLPVGIVAFATLRPRTATLLVVIGGWLILPSAAYDVPGLPDFTKAMAVAVAAMLGLVVFAGRQFAGPRFDRRDALMLAWCLVPGASSLANGHDPAVQCLDFFDYLTLLGDLFYDAAAVTLTQCVEWGVPWWVGRAVFADRAAMDDLARGLFVGGLAYVPLCLYEVRMSPQLHATVYGFTQHSFAQHIRQDGYRPLVFMEHGLMVGLWMAITTVVGFTLWRYGGLRRIGRTPAGPLLLVLLLTTLLCKSLGAIALLAVGVAAVVASRASGSKLPVRLLVFAPVLFVAARVLGGWQAGGFIELVAEQAPERASSLAFRIRSEQAFMAGIWEKPWFGWSSWGFDPPVSDGDEPMAFARDSFWLITAISYGLVGLALFIGVHLAPILALLRRTSAREWSDRKFAGTSALAVAVCLFVCDCMFNAMISPVYVMVAGGIASCARERTYPSAVRTAGKPRQLAGTPRPAR